MGDKDRTNRSPQTGGISSRLARHPFVLAGTAGAALVFSLALLLGAWLFWGWRNDDLGDRLPPGALADYVPEDSEAVLAVNLRRLREAPIGKQKLSPCLQQLIGQAERQLPWLALAGIKCSDDIDTLLISFAPGTGEEPLWLAQGRFDPSRFQIGPDKLQEKGLDHFRVWEFHERGAKRTTLLAAVGDALVASETPSRVQAALKQASDPRPARVRDAKLRELMTKIDRQQSLWLAASIRSLGPVSGIDNYLLKMVLRPFLTRAESVYGGFTCAEDLQAELFFTTATDEDATQLETDLKTLREAAPGAALLNRQNEWLPLMRLLSAGQIRRDGKTISLRCRLTPDQLEE